MKRITETSKELSIKKKKIIMKKMMSEPLQFVAVPYNNQHWQFPPPFVTLSYSSTESYHSGTAEN